MSTRLFLRLVFLSVLLALVVRGTVMIHMLDDALEQDRRAAEAEQGRVDAKDDARALAGTSKGEISAARSELRRGMIADVFVFTAGVLLLLAAISYVVVRMIERPLVRLASYASGTGGLGEPGSVGGVREIRVLKRVLRERDARIESERARERRVADVLAVLADGGSLEAVASKAIRSIVDEQRALFGAVWLLRRGSEIERVAAVGLASEASPGGSPIVEEAIRTGRRVVVHDVERQQSHVLRTTGVDVIPKRVIAAPLVMSAKVIGAIELGGELDDEARIAELDVILGRFALTLSNAAAADEVIDLNDRLRHNNDELSAQNEELRVQEEELRSQREQLVSTQAVLTAQAAELERASQAKTEFLSSVSHELRTPLNAIVGFTEVLLDGPDREPSPARRQHLMDVRDAARHLHSLVDDLVDIGRIEAGRVDLEIRAADVGAQVRQASALVAGAAEARRVRILTDVQPGLYCAADEKRLRQVLANLLSNAVRFSPEEGTVSVRASEQGATVRITVMDEGAGVSPAEAPRLFQRFAQLGAGLATRSGFGLGLAISKQLVERMGGKIGLSHTEPGRGATFFVELPRAVASSETARSKPAAPPAPEPKAPPRPSDARGGANVLVASNTAADVEVLRDLVSRAGHRVVVVTTTAETTAALEAHAFELLVVDLALDGARELAGGMKDRQARGPSVVALTASPLESTEVRELTAQGVLVVEKGVMTHRGFSDAIEDAVARAAGPLVLVVDDNDVNRRVARAMLEEARFTVVEASSGSRAIELAEQLEPRVIVMDVRMPGTNGLDATRQLRANARTESIPVVALSAQAMVGDASEAFAAGCVAYVTKPVSRRELVGAVSKALGRD